ncbi:probable xyloglucan galactosyltransferase GT17 [Raphanus sativus]|uniref:Probable xyloglucan galactosyltransferase GT17 n=1 Tax=Raphanus sativus TaxID=3726 RepID=A0A6J0KVV0_RAPSA|nr:probable xyloglucan galactosyltransferase GT17 [Raphanus sativus]
MAYNKKHVKIDLWPEKEEKEKKYSKNRETLKLTIPTLLLFCSICLIFLILLSPFTSPPQTTSFTASSLPRTCNQNFTVYVYDLPKEFNTNLLQNCRHLNIYTDMCPHVANNGLGQPLHRGGGDSKTWFATHQFIAEMIFHARVENHPCRTWEPNNADIFYIPFYGGLYASSVFREYNLTKRDELAVRLVDYISGQRCWRRSNGRDHFLAFGRTAWDFMRSSDEASPDFGANILMQMPRVRNMSVLTVERQPWDGDNQLGIPYPSYFHPYTSAEMGTWQEKMRSVERPHLFSFVGGPRKGLEKAAIRDELIRTCAGSSRCELLKCESGGSRCHDPMTVLGVMARSRFCLQAPGDSFTRRSTFDAMLAGCIPVFFSPHTMYTQYMWYLPDNKRSYSVFMDEKNSTLIEQELSRISENEVVQMREAVIEMIPKMTYAHPNATNYDLPDAVDIALEALAKQAKAKVVYSL